MSSVYIKPLIYPAISVVLFFVLLAVHKPKCRVSPKALELSRYVYKSWAPVEVPEVRSLALRDRVVVPRKNKTDKSVESFIEKLHPSVILKGEKEYLLLGGFFVEKGKEINGVRFLGVENDEILIQVQGKVYRIRM